MPRKSIIHIGWIIIVIVLTVNGSKASPLNYMNRLDEVTSYQSGEAFNLNLKFKKPLSGFKGPVFFPKSIQIEFDDTFIKPSKKFFPVKDEWISHIYAAQFDRQTVRVRLVLSEKGISLKNKLAISRDGRFLRIRIDKSGPDVLERFLDEIREPATARADDKSLEKTVPQKGQTLRSMVEKSIQSADTSSTILDNPQVDMKHILNREITKSVLDKTSLRKPETRNNPKNEPLNFLKNPDAFAGGPPDLTQTAMKMFSMLALLLGIMFFALHLFKKFVGTNGFLGGPNRLIQVLGTGMLAPRKNITMVEVAGQILVLGVSNDQITLLSTISDPNKINEIKETIKPGVSNNGRSHGVKQTAMKRQKTPTAVKAAEKVVHYVKKMTTPTPEKTILDAHQLIKKNLGKLRTA